MAMNNCQKAIEIVDQLRKDKKEDEFNFINCWENIGEVYHDQNNHRKARKYYKKTFKLLKHTKSIDHPQIQCLQSILDQLTNE